jgi:predicted phosphohydrolase
MMAKIATENFDVLVHCGDWCGGVLGWKSIKTTLQLINASLPDKPILAVKGNHDYWCQTKKPTQNGIRYEQQKPSIDDFNTNLEKIIQLFQEYKVHFLDNDGVYKHNNIHIAGVSGWYNNGNPPTNDQNFLPLGMDGDTHRFMLREAEKKFRNLVDNDLKTFDKNKDILVFVSHFPVIKPPQDSKFELYSWSSHIGDFLQEEYNCKYFLNGHAHQLHKGPLRYECGSDYQKPKYQIIEVPDVLC